MTTLRLTLIAALIAVPFLMRADDSVHALRGDPFRQMTLELSLKPFKTAAAKTYHDVAVEIFTQWQSLLRHTDTISLLMWTSDGSEILDYRGDPAQSLEWAKYLGNPNDQKNIPTDGPIPTGPTDVTLHRRTLIYRENPPRFTYGDLKEIVSTLKSVGEKMTGKKVKVGTTFDSGPEFAISDFKYNRHREILGNDGSVGFSFVSCYSVLKGDKVHYAAYPDGIPEGTPFGTFFGRQAQHFLTDMGFDSIWFSNGFGFGIEPWRSTGAVFDGKGFHAERLDEVRRKMIQFWDLFRKECPDYRIETRGTNFTTGTDLARDGVDLRALYRGNYNLLIPPNSPWAAIDRDVGLEMAGYMSRMAELPADEILFRYYIHDPWWMNSPWLDRYEREPYDIYLPLSVSRIDATGKVQTPTHLNLLTIDNSYGDLPTQVPDEVTPHILKARYDQPDAPGPLVWVYPFDEYHDWVRDLPRIPEVYFGDWFIRQAINTGFPLNTVTSTSAFVRLNEKSPDYFSASILVTVAPDANSPLEKALTDFLSRGGQLLIYGPADHSSEEFRKLLNLGQAAPLEGDFQTQFLLERDAIQDAAPEALIHRSLFSGGGIGSVLADPADAATELGVRVAQGGEIRDVVWTRHLPEWNGGRAVYVRGTNSASSTRSPLLRSDDQTKYVLGGGLMRLALQFFGYESLFTQVDAGRRSPRLAISRHENAWVFSGQVQDTTVGQSFRFPQGAPLFAGVDAQIISGRSFYHLPPSWHRECRVFVEQQQGIISCHEYAPVQKDIRQKLLIEGLKDAKVHLYPPSGVSDEKISVQLNVHPLSIEGKVSFSSEDSRDGRTVTVEHVTGSLVVTW